MNISICGICKEEGIKSSLSGHTWCINCGVEGVVEYKARINSIKICKTCGCGDLVLTRQEHVAHCRECKKLTYIEEEPTHL